ncbi:ubiquinol oxidase subunit II [Vibrio barjaei]|uniref:Ubiquinol oxidase subunit 2 n=1 Tax=Vibrio barjaei TaxID=1676683 RepID=A0ABW7IJB0_9VIBR|nr:ubiquinol oxidase subunit II [Vibrio barjaei]OIN25106.1 ubiquinol oxidase subunit II [Vibrio barjaei]
MKASRYQSILLRGGVATAILTLSGCSSALLDPKGAIGVQEKELIITALLLMLIVVIPVILMTVYFAYRYRSTNTEEEYAPDWAHSTKIEVVVWTIPIIIIAILAVITWRSTHALEPSKPIAHPEKPLTIEVVSLDWKWLFIYPEQGIATVNYVAFPKDVPVTFKITSDNIMNAFFIPRLGSQIYAMPGMVTRLNLIANHQGDYKGFASSYSGKGFSEMKFTAAALENKQAFSKWVDKVKHSPKQIENWQQYRALAEPSVADPVSLYSSVPPALFNDVVTQYPGSMNRLPEHEG